MASPEDIDAVCKVAAFVERVIKDDMSTRFDAIGGMTRPPEGEVCTLLLRDRHDRLFEVRVSRAAEHR